MSRATQHLNRNKQFLIGIAAMAFAVLFVVILFISMCYGKLEEQDKKGKNYYQLEFTSDFQGKATQLYVNDSLLFDALVTDSVTVRFKPFEEDHTLFVVDKVSGNSRNFNLNQKPCEVQILKDTEGKVQIKQQEWEKK